MGFLSCQGPVLEFTSGLFLVGEEDEGVEGEHILDAFTYSSPVFISLFGL